VTFDKETERLTAGVRFGIGASAADIDAMGDDPRGWLTAQLDETPPAPEAAVPPDIQSIAKPFFEQAVVARRAVVQNDVEAAQKARQARRQAGRLMNSALSIASVENLAAAAESSFPFRERLIRFWHNHFAVQSTSRQGKVLLPFFANSAISPFVTLPFHQMLTTVSQHPAMLLYLDNVRSTGPNSPLGLSRNLGLNENLAREILELHTLGVNGGYTQKDVRELAEALTGWRIGKPTNEETAWRSLFRPARHEPGGATILGQNYPDKSERTAEHILRDLAKHPSTARHIATKLARHFVDDNPPEAAIQKLERCWLETEGDLGEVSRILVGLDEPRTSLFSKLKQPGDFVLSSLRALDVDVTPMLANLAVAHQKTMGQPLLDPPGPQGWYDTAADWSDPGSLARRVDWGVALASAAGDRVDALAAMERNLGSFATRDTRLAIERAPTRQEAAAILIASPLFQRR
jgi:uncharacterized protein (DUF1800 family)